MSAMAIINIMVGVSLIGWMLLGGLSSKLVHAAKTGEWPKPVQA